MTTVREQHAALMLGFDNPSDADMLALLEYEELRELRSLAASPVRRSGGRKTPKQA